MQEFLLLNHPVDCPICDQAGECRLQDYWLEHQHAKKRMRDEPVHKPKAVVFGPTIVYDAERCIACTRCIRFCDEVAKDPVLSLRQRGNLNEITVAPGRQLDNNYTLMTEYVCPVGALTARDFRFKARVWFLRSVESVCTGCARGCNSYTDFDPRVQKVYRYRPRQNDAVNGHWMCDLGMLSYSRVAEGRLLEAAVGGTPATSTEALAKAAELLRGVDAKKIAVLMGAEFSLEDNAVLLLLARKLGVESIFESGRPPGTPDGILLLADRNPNSAGIQALLDSDPLPIAELAQGVASGRFTHLLSLGATLKEVSVEERLATQQVTRIVLASHRGSLTDGAAVVVPVACWAEVDGVYVNAGGLAQRSRRAVLPPNGVAPAYRQIADLAQLLGHLPEKLTLGQVRAMIGSDDVQLSLGTERLARIALPDLSDPKFSWGTQIGPSTDQQPGLQPHHPEASGTVLALTPETRKQVNDC